MANRLVGKKIALLLEEGYEDSEVTVPLNYFKEEGASVRFIGSGRKTVFTSRYGASLSADITAKEARLSDFDAFIIPGGFAPEKMRLSDSLVKLISDADESGKIIAAIGRGPQLLISAGVTKDRMLTCYVGIIIDVKNSGGYYVDESVVRDGNLITSRTIPDLPEFLELLTESLGATTILQKNMFAGA